MPLLLVGEIPEIGPVGVGQLRHLVIAKDALVAFHQQSPTAEIALDDRSDHELSPVVGPHSLLGREMLAVGFRQDV